MRRPGLGERAKAYWQRWRSYGALVGSSPGAVQSAWGEFGRSSQLFRELDAGLRTAPGIRGGALGANLWGTSLVEQIVTGFGPSAANRELYTFVRLTRPARVIETGVASGISTAIILSALERNGEGHLWSIDFPNFEGEGYVNADGQRETVRVPAGREPGWVVPDRLRSRWELVLGRSSDVLPALLKRVGPIGMFFHDSEHSEANMTFEYRTAWAGLGPGGLLYSDDVIWNRAFEVFSLSVGVRPSLTPAGRGAIRRPADCESA
jgi:hypothetical protein